MAGVWPVCHVGRENGGLGESSKIGRVIVLGKGRGNMGEKENGEGARPKEILGKREKNGREKRK